MTPQMRGKIAKQVAALLAKNLENGATEHEAFAAAQKARELIDKYGLSKEAIEHDVETIGIHAVKRDNYKTFVIKDQLADYVARYCDSKVWIDRKAGTTTFFGMGQDRAFAGWLLESLDLFVRNQTVTFMEAKGFKAGAGPWDMQKGFMTGCIARIQQRLHMLAEERIRTSKPGGRGKSLVHVKMGLVEATYAKLNIPTAKEKIASKKGDSRSFSAGVAAGDRATFNRPLGNGAGLRLVASN